jgi:hypothetical protein
LTGPLASTCNKDLDTGGVIGGVTFIAAQDNGICTNGDLDTYWLGGQLYVAQSGGNEAGFTISRINADGTPTFIAQRSWTVPANTADIAAFKQGGRQYLSLALEGSGGGCGIVIIDVTDAPDITGADTVAQVSGTGWCSVHNNFVESFGGEGRYIYLTANATRDMRVLDIADLDAITEVGRYTHPQASGSFFVHDVTVIDHGGSIGRRVYVSYWDAGLMILDAEHVTPGIIEAGSPNQPLNLDNSIDPSPSLHIHHAFPTHDGTRVFIQDEFATQASNQSLDMDEPVQMWDISNPAVPVYVDGIDLGSPLQPLVNPPHNLEVRYDLDVDGDGTPDRNRLYAGWYRGGLQAFDFTSAGFTGRPLYHQVQTEGVDGVWDGAWAVRIERVGGNVYTFQSDRRYGLIVERIGDGPPVPTPTATPVGTPTPTPDSDGDGYNDAEDNCASVANGTQDDGDNDALGDACEASPHGTNPQNPDSDDGDGCGDGREVRTLTYTPNRGGDRDPLSRWDFFDVPSPAGPATGTDGKLILATSAARNGAVTLQDVGVVLAYVGRSAANPAYAADANDDGLADGEQLDRSPSAVFGKPWRSGPPNSAISLQDVGVALAQVGHSCTIEP